jgi:predicted O-methyltransferase YrrM
VSTIAVILAALAAYFCGLFITYRRRFYLATGRDQGYRIPTVSLSEFHERFRLTEAGPTTDAEVTMIGGGDSVPAGTTDREAWILSVLSKDAKILFEFGTATGKTAYLMARNSPASARVITITLPAGRDDLYHHAQGDSAVARSIALRESSSKAFLYAGTDVENKISQLYQDSKQFDHEPYRGRCDLVFVDGAHAQSYVMSDSRKAFDMVSPTGTIVWHDYKKRSVVHRGVMRALNEIARAHPLKRLAGTHMVAYRRAWEVEVPAGVRAQPVESLASPG